MHLKWIKVQELTQSEYLNNRCTEGSNQAPLFFEVKVLRFLPHGAMFFLLLKLMFYVSVAKILHFSTKKERNQLLSLLFLFVLGKYLEK